MNKKMVHTERGRLYKKLDSFRQRKRKKGYRVEISFREFYYWYQRQNKCYICYQLIGIDRSNIAISVHSLGKNLTIRLENIYLAHISCITELYRGKAQPQQNKAEKCKKTRKRKRQNKGKQHICVICAICGIEFNYDYYRGRKRIRCDNCKHKSKWDDERKEYHRAWRHSATGRASQKYKLLRRRCEQKTHHKYPRYGGRGIKLIITRKEFYTWYKSNKQCVECGTDFDYSDLAKCQHIHRINNNGHYEIKNIIALCPRCHRSVH